MSDQYYAATPQPTDPQPSLPLVMSLVIVYALVLLCGCFACFRFGVCGPCVDYFSDPVVASAETAVCDEVQVSVAPEQRTNPSPGELGGILIPTVAIPAPSPWERRGIVIPSIEISAPPPGLFRGILIPTVVMRRNSSRGDLGA